MEGWVGGGQGHKRGRMYTLGLKGGGQDVRVRKDRQGNEEMVVIGANGQIYGLEDALGGEGLAVWGSTRRGQGRGVRGGTLKAVRHSDVRVSCSGHYLT